MESPEQVAVAGSHEQFLRDIKQIFSQGVPPSPYSSVDILKLSGAEWVRLLASEFIVSSLVGWCQTCERTMWTYEIQCVQCGTAPVILDDMFWERVGRKIKAALRHDHQLLSVVKAEREDLYRDGRAPVFPPQLDWLRAMWTKALRPASRPFNLRRHYELANSLHDLAGLGLSEDKVLDLLSVSTIPDGKFRLNEKGLFSKLPGQFLRTIRDLLLNHVGTKRLHKEELWRTKQWVNRQRLTPLARLRGERPRMRKSFMGPSSKSI